MINSKPLIIANWKLHKTQAKIKNWLNVFTSKYQPDGPVEVAIAISFPYLTTALSPWGLKLAAQDVSQFKHSSAHTGEVSAQQLADLGVGYVIVGHSERRRDFGETDQDVIEKIKRCLEHNLTPVICISSLNEVKVLTTSPNKPLASNTQHLTLAYEPLEAIGSGQPESPKEAREMALAIKEILGENTRVLYGGSVDSGNVADYISLDYIDGVLVGSASLDPTEFSALVQETIRVSQSDEI